MFKAGIKLGCCINKSENEKIMQFKYFQTKKLFKFDYICPIKCGSSSVVEHQLPKLRVAGSTPVSRSKTGSDIFLALFESIN